MELPIVLSRFVQPGKVFIFSTTNCPYCDKVKELFDTYEVKWESVTVTTHPDLKDNQEFLKILHDHSKIQTYPKVYIGTTCVGGYDATYKLSQNMKLFYMMKSENISFADDDML